jgi:chromosome segregation ATPase
MSAENSFGGDSAVENTPKGRMMAKSADELKKARESRAADALKMKDEQLRILSEQNASLLQSLDKVEDEANSIQMEKLAIEQENRSIRDSNFELQSKARAAETQSKRMASEVSDKEKQLRIMTDQNSELLRLLESEEALAAQLQGEVAEIRAELDEIRLKHGALLTTAKTHEELAVKAAREGQLRAEEIRLLRAESEQLKQQNAELKMKTQVEVEALQEQLRVRKEKQYQLLEKLQAQEEAKRQAEDQVAGMEEQLRGLHARSVELETQLQVELRAKGNLEETNKELQTENNNLYNQNKELQVKIEKSEKERLRMEAEARDSGEQLREMAEKVFQLLERLKLAELGKTKAMEALKKKEQDMVSLQKKNARLIKESTEEGRARVKAELDIKVLQDQVRTLKKHNQTIAAKSKEEALLKVKALEDVEQLQEKLRTLESRLSFLLNKVQADEESRIIQAEDRKKLEAQVVSFTEKCEELNKKLIEMGESNRIITQAMRLKQEELNEMTIKYESLHADMQAREAADRPEDKLPGEGENMSGARPGAPDDSENVRLNEGRGRFYVEAKSVGGGSMLLLRGRKPLYREWLDKMGANDFLKKSQKTTRFRDMIVEKFAAIYGLLMVEEEDKTNITNEMSAREQQVEHLQRKLSFVQDSLAVEEDAKRRMLLRYIHAVKEHATAVGDGTGGVLQLPESNITDEEIHALAALLRNNTNIDELNLRGNNITDDGARALGAVLAGRSGLRMIDLRGNKIGKGAIRVLAEALERSERVRHVYVHAGGKIEALGAGKWANKPESDEPVDPKLMVTVETVCVVDVRENNPEAIETPYELQTFDNPNASKGRGSGEEKFNATDLLKSTNQPGKDAILEAPKTKKKALGKLNAKRQSQEEPTPAQIAKQEKEARQQLMEERALLAKESAWQGRAGTMESYDSQSTEKQSVRLGGRGAHTLPPLERAGSAPDHGGHASAGLDDSAEAAVMTAIQKARSKQNKAKKASKTEMNLFNSPFAESLTKMMTGVDSPNGHTH